MSTAIPVSGVSPALTVPGVWPATQGVGAWVGPVCPTGHALLDAALTGGGWPTGALVDVLCPIGSPLAAMLAWPSVLVRMQLQQQGPGNQAGGRVVLVGAPATPSVQAWHWRGLAPWQWAQVQTDDPARRLWACEQALACPEVGAVMAWLPQASFQALRRLQLAASRHGGLLWVCRPQAARTQPSPAVLRMLLEVGKEPGQLRVQIVKQRGCAEVRSLSLSLADPWARHLLEASRWRQSQQAHPSWSGLETAPISQPWAEGLHEPIQPTGPQHGPQHAHAQLARLLGRLAQPVLSAR